MPKEVDLKPIKKILVCMFKYHGDLLLIAPFLQALKNHIPHANIDCFVFCQTKDMIQGHPAINRVITYKRKKSIFKRILYDLNKGCDIRSEGYDLVFNMSQGDRGALFCMISGAKIKVGFESKGYGFFMKDKVFTHLVAKTEPTRHIVELNLDPLRILGIQIVSPEDRELYFQIDERSRFEVRELLAKDSIVKGEFILCHPISRCSFKHWPTQHWARFIEALQVKGIKVVLSGGTSKDQKDIISAILRQIKSHKDVYNYCGKTTLKGLAAMIDESRALVTIDSVPLHISSALKKPVVAIFGPSIERKWGPYQNPQSRVVAMPLACRSCDLEGCANSWRSECLENLPVQKVCEALFSLLECKAFA